MNLAIRKLAEGVFKFIISGGLNKEFKNPDVKISSDGNQVMIRNGFNEYPFKIDNVLVFDDTDASTEEDFADTDALFVRLSELGLKNFNGGGSAPTIGGLVFTLIDGGFEIGDGTNKLTIKGIVTIEGSSGIEHLMPLDAGRLVNE